MRFRVKFRRQFRDQREATCRLPWATGGSEWGLAFSVICLQILVFAVKLANILMFAVFGENTV